MMDNEKDLFIKQKLQRDELISKKADDVFNNFLKGEINIEESNTQTNEKVVNFKEKKQTRFVAKKAFSAVASLMIIFLAANAYAATQGYNNIFFIIRNLINNEAEISNKKEILSDRDITISYKSIEIAKGIKMQINRLVVEKENAKLYIEVDYSETKLNILPFTFIVTDENGKEFCNYKSENTSDVYTEELILNNFSDDTKIINLNVNKNNNSNLVKFKINLETQEIEVIGAKEEIEKISEVELKKYLSAFAFLNFEDSELTTKKMKEELLNNERKILVAKELANLNAIKIYSNVSYGETENEYALNYEEINSIIESFSEVEYEKDGLLKLGNVYFSKDKIDGKKVYLNKGYYDGKLTALCLDVKDIMYSQGIYTVTYTYCYPYYDASGDSYEEGIEKLPIYEMTIGLTINDDDKYSKYYVSSIMESELISSGEKEEESIEEPIDVKKVCKENFEMYMNLRGLKESAPEEVPIRLGLFTYSEFFDCYNNSNNIITELMENVRHIKTNVKYKDFQSELLKYVTQEIIDTEFYTYKNYNGFLAVLDGGATGVNYEVEGMLLISEDEENSEYYITVKEIEEEFLTRRYMTVTFQKINESYVVAKVKEKNENISDLEESKNENTVTENIISNNVISNTTVAVISNPIKESLIGKWWRTFNVTTSETEKILSWEFEKDNTFIEETNGEITGRGKYEIVTEYNWDKVRMTYENGKTIDVLYGTAGSNKTNQRLHFSLGQQLFDKEK